MKWIQIKFSKTYDDHFYLGASMSIHHHHYKDSLTFHFHLTFNLTFWFLELTIGKEEH